MASWRLPSEGVCGVCIPVLRIVQYDWYSTSHYRTQGEPGRSFQTFSRGLSNAPYGFPLFLSIVHLNYYSMSSQ